MPVARNENLPLAIHVPDCRIPGPCSLPAALLRAIMKACIPT